MARRRKRAAQPKLRSTTQRRGSSTKPRLASGSLTTSSGDAVLKAGKQIAQRIDGQMNFRALLALGPVLAGAGTAGGGRLQRPVVQNGGRWIRQDTRAAN